MVPESLPGASTWMLAEIRETPAAIERLLVDGQPALRAAAAAIRAFQPRLAVIVARGTSDHAGTYARYLLELVLGIPVALAAPSLTTVYGASTRWDGALLLAVSQSGAGPDVAAVTAVARRAGALTVALTNEPSSLLAAEAEFVVPLFAGPERAVAATKTYVAELAAVAWLAMAAAERESDLDALRRLPVSLERTIALAETWLASDDSPVEAMTATDRAITVSRGVNLATALEVALKLKETCRIFAEGYSSADLMHGPVFLAGPTIPTIAFDPGGPASSSLAEGIERIAAFGARTWVVAARDGTPALHAGTGASLVLGLDVPEALTPIALVLPGQLLAEAVSRGRGLDPDAPSGLTKVTRTV